MKQTNRLRWALPTTRVLSAVMAGLVLLQGVFAGGFLSGNSSLLDLHEMFGTEVLTVVGLVTAVAALLAVRQQWWPLAVAVLAWVGIGLQIAMGFAGRLDVHVPLGITLFGLYLAVAIAARRKEPA